MQVKVNNSARLSEYYTCDSIHNVFHSAVVRQHSNEDLIVGDIRSDPGESLINHLRGTDISSRTQPASDFELVEEMLVWSIGQTSCQLILVL